MGPVLF